MSEEDSSPFITTDLSTRRASGQGFSWSKNCDFKCCVVGCSSSTMCTPNLWFHKLPKRSTKDQTHKRTKWLQQMGQKDFQIPVPTLVCEKHFTHDDFNRKKGKCRLKKTAIPSLLLPPHHKKPINKSKPKHVYQRTVPDGSKCNITKPEEQSTQQESPQNNSNDSGNDRICNNISQMDIDHNENYSDDNQSNNEDNQSNNDDNQSDNDNNHSDNDSNQCYKDDSQNNQDNNHNEYCVNQKTSHSGSTLSNETLNSLNDLYLKLKSKKENSRNKYSDEYKLKVFQLYYENTEAYKLLQCTLELPPVSTLPSYAPSTLDGINDFYMSSLIDKVGLMPIKHKFGVICVSVMRIQPVIVYDDEKDKLSGIWLGTKTGPLQYAMITMVRGIVEDWHHIVSIHLLPSLNMCTEYSTIIEEKLATRLLEIGLNIKAVVTTTDDLFVTATILKCQSFFLVKNFKIYHIFDPKHLMLLLYDELNHYNVFYYQRYNSKKNKTIARWEHINKYYECDKTRKFKLTDQPNFINKNESHKNKLEAATQILSFKTAMGMSMFCNMKILDNTVMETVDFLVRINSIFADLYPKEFNFKQKVTPDDYNVWCNNIEYIRSAFVTSNSDRPKFPEYLVITMQSVAFLQSVSYLIGQGSVLMHCLNLDPLVEFIDKINLKRFKNKYPTASELIDTLKHGFMQNNYHNIKKYEENDSKLDNFIEDATALSKQNCFIKNNLEQTNIAKIDYTQFSHEDANSMCYISIYLLDKMYKMFKNALSSRMKHLTSSVAYEYKRRGFCGSIIVPDNEFIDFVNNMDVIFVAHFKKAMGTGRLFEVLMKEFNKQIVTGPIDLAPLQYIKELFLKLRIYHTIKYNNETFQSNDSDYHQFVACRLNSLGLNCDT